jgi:hypothetical protein
MSGIRIAFGTPIHSVRLYQLDRWRTSDDFYGFPGSNIAPDNFSTDIQSISTTGK